MTETTRPRRSHITSRRAKERVETKRRTVKLQQGQSIMVRTPEGVVWISNLDKLGTHVAVYREPGDTPIGTFLMPEAS